ncbi:CoA transferase [Putridiphycobacter roseus]|uniref:CoA transferase n=2 Tax=Putridiphycobacter roseus TaxID=2219161 RepID=A0A2W1NVW9_9FLAO|nr:CoA transferase [Putridiphycobacter roseus]
MRLENLKVVELASVLAGPAVGMFFAELGAQVIKIENKKNKGDVTRTWKLPTEDKSKSSSAYFAAVNYGKQHLFLDLLDTDDFQQVLQLIREADIVITNFKKGDDFKFKLDYKTLKALNPSLIYGAINGFGVDSDRVAYDLILQAETGYMAMNGTSNSGPIKMPVAMIDILAAHQLKEGLLIALLNRKEDKGALVTVSLYDAAITSLVNQASNFLMANHIAKPIGSLHPNIAPYGELFETKDALKITFAIGSDKQFRLLMDHLNLSPLVHDASFKSNAERVVNRVLLSELMQKKIALMKGEPLLDFCHTHFIPAGEIKNIQKVFEVQASKSLVLESFIEKQPIKVVKSIAFKIS